MRHSTYLLYFFLLIGLIACESGIDSEAVETSMAKEEQLQAPSTDTSLPVSERKIIRVADLRFQVKDLTESSTKVEELIKKYGATIKSSRSFNASESIQADYTIKVLPEKLNDLIKDIQSESIFLDNKTITADDVTRQYVDIEARVKAKQAAQKRYLELLEQANKVEDVLAIEVELRKLQEELESVQAQLKALQQQTSYSTINLSMYQLVPTSYSDRTSFSTRITSALSGGWHLFKELLVGLVYLWPLLIVAVLVIGLVRWQKRRRRGIV